MAQPQMNLSASLRRAVDTDAGQEMYDNVSNAVLEALDRSCYSTKLSKSDKAKFVTELRIQGQQIVHSLMTAVKEASAELQRSELGPLKAREIQLLADVAEEKQQNRNLQYQMQSMRDLLERIKKMHAEELEACTRDMTKKFERELAKSKEQLDVELEKLKTNFSAASIPSTPQERADSILAESKDFAEERAQYVLQIKSLQEQLAQNKELKSRGAKLEAFGIGDGVTALKREHAEYVAKLKEGHREELYAMQAKNAKLQKEMSLRLDPLQISSQDSGISLGGTGKRTVRRNFLDSSMGRTGPRRPRESPLARKVNFQDTVEMEDEDDDEMNETSRSAPLQKDSLRRHLDGLNAQWERIQANKKSRIVEH